MFGKHSAFKFQLGTAFFYVDPVFRNASVCHHWIIFITPADYFVLMTAKDFYCIILTMKNDLKKEILKKLNKNLETLSREYQVKFIGVFGSTVRGEHKKKSDIDILAEFNKPIGFFKFIKLENHLSKILGRKVDLVTKDALKPQIKSNILKEVEYV